MTASSPPTVSSSVYADGCVYLFIFFIFSLSLRLLLSLLLRVVKASATVLAQDQSCSDSLGLQIHIQSTL